MITALLFALTASPMLMKSQTVAVPTPGSFDYMCFDEKYRRVYASHPAAGSLVTLDLAKGTPEEIPTGEVNGVVVYQDKIFTGGGGSIAVTINRENYKILNKVTLPGAGDDVVLDTKRNHLVVCEDDKTRDFVYNAGDLSSAGTIDIGEGPEFVLYSAKKDRIYQNIKVDNEVQVIDPESLKVTQTWQVGDLKGPHGMAMDEKMGVIFVAGSNGKLIEMDMDSGKILAESDISVGPDQIAYDPGKHYVVSTGRGGHLSVVHASKKGRLTLVGTFDCVKGAHTLCIDPKTHDVWVSTGVATTASLVKYSWTAK